MISFLNIKTILQFKSLIGLCLIVGLLSGCASGGQISYKPTSAGKTDEILWVMNDALWADTVGITINHKFLASYDVLPQAEPKYFLRKKNFQQFNNDIIKKYRTIVICVSAKDDPQYDDVAASIELKDTTKSGPLIFKNVWAAPQVVIVLAANDKDQLFKKVNQYKDEVEAVIREAEDERIDILLYENGLNYDAINLVSKKFNYDLDIPSAYFVGTKNKDFVWLRKETFTLSSNFLLYKRELKPEEIKDGVDWKMFALQVRGYLGKSYISTRTENSYMIMEEKYAPILQEQIQFLGHNAIKSKGLWKMENDFMGGSFVNIAWFDETNSTYYMIDGYVHAPKESKKKYMRHINSILQTAKKEE